MSSIDISQHAEIVYTAVVLRGVPCSAHDVSLVDCPNCLSGGQAAALGIDHVRDDLGVIARGKLSPKEAATFLGARLALQRGAARIFNKLQQVSI